MRVFMVAFGVWLIATAVFLPGCRGHVGGYGFEFVPTHFPVFTPVSPASTTVVVEHRPSGVTVDDSGDAGAKATE
jgi:hypothetical protein